MRKGLKYLFIFLQWTWGLIQTIVGFMVYMCFKNCVHEYYRGCINTKWNYEGGLSLGMFIFSPKIECQETREIKEHEYGHAVQSLILGPAYLIVIGIPSVIWAKLPYFRKLRKDKGVKYTACLIEKWASDLGKE